jgi:hypothetical protein
MEQLKKITIKTVFGNVKGEVSKKEPSLHVLRVWGSASGTKIVTTSFGDSIGLTGRFGAINPVTGEEFRAGRVFLPEMIAENVAHALASGADTVQFGYDIMAEFNPTVATGYQYRCVPLVEEDKETDPLALMAKELPKMPKLLTAPETKNTEKTDSKKK